MNWSEIAILYRRELRSAFRERTIVVNGVLIPIFLYPIILWAMFTGITFVQGVNESFVSRVAIEGRPPEPHQALLDTLAGHEGVEIRGGPGAGEEPLLREAWDAALAEGELDAIVAFAPVEGGGLADNFSAHVRYDRVEERSRQARERIREIVGDYRDDWLAREGEALALDARARTVFALRAENVSSSEEVGQSVLGQMFSIFLVFMVALGCFIPSVDTTAGERERSTWETMMTLSVSRSSIVVAKYLYVATLGVLAGVLNVVALVVSVGAILQPLVGSGEAVTFSIPWLGIPVMLAGAVVTALLFAAIMMILASFARSFKDGQAMVTPAYYLVFLAFLAPNQTDVHLSAATAFVPLVNIAVMVRDAVGGVFMWEWIGVTLALTLGIVVVLLFVARQILRFEEFLLGGFDGSFWRFAKEKLSP